MRPEPNDPTRSGAPLSGVKGKLRLSRNEMEALCTKAARGAGMSWGHAEEAGFAVGWLSAHGIDGASALLAHLQGSEGKAWRDIAPVLAQGRWRAAGDVPLCPIALGATLSDHCDLPEGRLCARELDVATVSQPVLVLPFLAAIAGRLGRPVEARWAGGWLRLDGNGAMAGDIRGLADLPTAGLTLSAGGPPVERGASRPARDCDQKILVGLNAFAMQTTVPPSEESRSGAGSGTSDND